MSKAQTKTNKQFYNPPQGSNQRVIKRVKPKKIGWIIESDRLKFKILKTWKQTKFESFEQSKMN